MISRHPNRTAIALRIAVSAHEHEASAWLVRALDAPIGSAEHSFCFAVAQRYSVRGVECLDRAVAEGYLDALRTG